MHFEYYFPEGRDMTKREYEAHCQNCLNYAKQCVNLIANVITGKCKGDQALYDRIWRLSHLSNTVDSYQAELLNEVMEKRKKSAENPNSIRADYTGDDIREWFASHRSTGNKKLRADCTKA